MRCKNCGKSIEDNKTFCTECKRVMKKISSRKEVSELEQLIEDQKKLNELENTKELVELSSLVENVEEKYDSEENTNIIDSQVVIETREEKHKDIKKKNKIKMMIVIISIVILVLIVLILYIVVFRNKENINSVEEINYERVLDQYGKVVEEETKSFVSENSETPTWQYVVEKLNYKKYDVVCEIHNIYSDGSIYLNECKVNSKEIEFSYGEEKEEVKEGKKISIYRKDLGNGYYSYFETKESDTIQVGSITCKTEECRFMTAYSKYALILEDSKYYLYNYESGLMEFGPFILNSEYEYQINLLSYKDKLYGVYYVEDNKANIYNVTTGKTITNVKGDILASDFYLNSNIMYKYNYVILKDNNKNNFVNLKTGNISFSIPDNLARFIEGNNIVYITTYTNDIARFKIYNSNGKQLFNGKEYSLINVFDGYLIVSDGKTFSVYDSKLNKKTSSKSYDEVMALYEDFIVVNSNNHLSIVDIDDKELATFEDEWDSSKYVFYSALSGWNTNNGKYGIYLVVENTDIPYGTNGSGIEYYYIPVTKEIGKIGIDELQD